MNCLYNNLVTSTKTPECNSSSKPLGEKIKYAARQQGSGPARPPLHHGSFLPEYKSLVTCGLQRIKSLSCMSFLSNIKDVLDSSLQETRVVNVSENHVLLKRFYSFVRGTVESKTWRRNGGH